MTNELADGVSCRFSLPGNAGNLANGGECGGQAVVAIVNGGEMARGECGGHTVVAGNEDLSPCCGSNNVV